MEETMAKIIMVQGTASGVGKSILSTALCRILVQNGLTVAPFKSQNMSSNYHLLPNGDKMARSQAIAAYACGIEPSADMNPILLMPHNTGGTQVILCGKSVGNMSSLAYCAYKKKAREESLAAFHRLSCAYDVIVVEGAGSPVEMNLMKDDIVNMGLAQEINAPVILVSDINRGGVFASLYGTMMLLTKEQRALVKGLVINKFRGDISHFGEGKSMIEQLCSKPVVGIIPYTDVRIEDEDSLTDFGCAEKTRASLTAQTHSGDDEGYRTFLDAEFDRIAEHFRVHLDMDKILSETLL